MDDKTIKDICDKIAQKYSSEKVHGDSGMEKLWILIFKTIADMVAEILIEYNRLSEKQSGQQ